MPEGTRVVVWCLVSIGALCLQPCTTHVRAPSVLQRAWPAQLGEMCARTLQELPGASLKYIIL